MQLLEDQNEADPRLQVLSFIAMPVWVFDVERLRIVWANAAALEYWDAVDIASLAERDMSVGLSNSAHVRLRQLQHDCHEQSRSFSEFWTVHPNGVPHSAESLVSPFQLDGKPNGLLMQLIQIDVKSDSNTLHSAQALMHTSSMISLYDADLNLVYSNPAARSALPDGCTTLAAQLVDPGDLSLIRTRLESDGGCLLELKVRTAEGIVWHAVDIRLSPDWVSGEQSVLVSATDVTDRHEAQARAFKLAYADPLTGLMNRSALLSDLDILIDRSIADGTGFGLLFLDLDRFKVVNDSLGHAVGDQLLVLVADCLQTIVGGCGIVSRLGGDEFVVIDRCVGSAGSEALAVEILERMSAAFEIGGRALRVTPSIGICRFPEHGTNTTDLMRHADTAMYAAKANQCGYRTFDTDLYESIVDRLQLESDLAVAIEKRQFLVYYQPRIDSATEALVGFEALVRWQHPTRGLVPPLEFISIAEEAGLIVELGNQVMLAAMQQQKAWQDAGLDVRVSINLSAKQFVGDELLATVESMLALSGADVTRIELEITESVLLGDSDAIVETLAQLTGLGLRLALDDFGTGYSNLAYLRKYPLHCLKIDRAFLADVENRALLEVMLGMGEALGLDVVAEGVETREQIDWLQARNCAELQGYWISKPMPTDAATAFIHDWTALSPASRKAA